MSVELTTKPLRHLVFKFNIWTKETDSPEAKERTDFKDFGQVLPDTNIGFVHFWVPCDIKVLH